MEIQQGKQTLIGFPALIDQGDAVTIEVFDEPDIAAARHRQGLRRLCALQVKDALKYLEKNIPDLQKMAVAYMPLGTQEELRAQILDVALERAFVQEPLPQDAAQFAQRVQEGRARLTLIAQEVARLAATILTEYASAQRKIKDTKNAPEATAGRRQAATKSDAQGLHRPHPLGAAAALRALPEGHHHPPGQSTAPTRPAMPPS